MSRLSDTRETLAAALRTEGVLPEWRIHDMPPSNIAAPCIWIDLPSVGLTDLGARGARMLAGTWPVALVVDGADQAQVALLDDAGSQAWDALDALQYTDVLTMAPQSFDVGGPRTRGLVLTVQVQLLARTLCPPSTLANLVPTP